MRKLPVITGMALLFLFHTRLLPAQESFVCRDNYYLALTDGAVLTTVYEVTIDPSSGNVVFEALSEGTSGADLNGLGYRYTDNFIYGVNSETLELYRVGRDGTARRLTALNPNRYLRYVGGDVSPDGRYLVLVGNNSFEDVALLFVDLDSPNYEQRELRLSGPEVRSADIAFDPVDGRLYGFDGIRHRLVTYDLNTGAVTAGFPATSEAVLMGGLFFDSFGNLFGYGVAPGQNAQRVFYSIDKETGAVRPETTGPPASRNDGCSCPYTVSLRETVDAEPAIPCTQVPIRIEIANSSKDLQKGLRLEQRFPESFRIVNIDSPLEGELSAGGPGSHFFTLENLTVPLGRHEITITVELQSDAEGIHQLQATLSGLPVTLGEVALSDNPATLVQQDPTLLSVGELSVNFTEVETQVCSGKPIVLDPGVPGASYRWSDGSTGPTLSIARPGTYAVTVSTGCETVEEIITVDGIGLELELGPDRQVELGESLQLRPETTPKTEELTYFWTSSAGEVACPDCFELLAEPLSDTWYHLTATDDAGCFVKDSLLVKVIKDRSVYLPNAFSPNGDGINDYFYLQSKRSETVLDFKVFDRWGNLLFENAGFYTNDPAQGWDGRFRGKALPGGVYYFAASIRFLDKEVERLTGEVEIVK